MIVFGIWYLLVRLKAQAGSSNHEKTRELPNAGKRWFSAQHRQIRKKTHTPIIINPKIPPKKPGQQKNKQDHIDRILVVIVQSHAHSTSRQFRKCHWPPTESLGANPNTRKQSPISLQCLNKQIFQQPPQAANAIARRRRNISLHAHSVTTIAPIRLLKAKRHFAALFTNQIFVSRTLRAPMMHASL